MSFAPRILLLLPLSEPAWLEPFVEGCLNDKVRLIAVVGEGARETEDLIDEIIVADGSDPNRYLSITTTAHTEDPLSEVLAFARTFDADEVEGLQCVSF